eukprot:m.66744 g.66744  ORF g.66744 m.66744 type:complete len:558 (-) comp8383_c0_seq1:66-1739(-)
MATMGPLVAFLATVTTAAASQPNLIFIMADDLGYGDLASYSGNPVSETPNLDTLAMEGMKFLSMYSASPVCSPSRSAVMSGRFMTRTGVWPGVFGPASVGGLALNETTLPSLLKTVGYDTFMAGKWHLGVGKDGAYLPYNRGFDHYYGVPYGIDMCSQETVRDIVRDTHPAGACFAPNVSCLSPQAVGGHANFGGRENEVPCPFFVNATIMEQPTALLTIDDKYVAATVEFIEQHRAADTPPYFIYFASHHTHTPAFAKANFTNTSVRGWFGDHLRTLDWSVGELVQAVRDSDAEQHTFIMFSADNGPSLTWEDLGGMNGPMRCGKGTTWEGGQRVPSIAWWPGTVKPNTITRDIFTSMDFFATAAELAGATLPTDRTYDTISYVDVLKGAPTGKRDTFYYWGSDPNPQIGLHAVRFKNYKLHWVTQGSHCGPDYPDKACPDAAGLVVLAPENLLLYDLDISPGETRNLTLSGYPDVVAHLTKLKHDMEMQPDIFGPSQVHRGQNSSFEPCAPQAQAKGCDAKQPQSSSPHWPLCCQLQPPPSWNLGKRYATAARLD